MYSGGGFSIVVFRHYSQIILLLRVAQLDVFNN